MDSVFVLRKDWHLSEERAGVDCASPGIYIWTIEGGGVYVGKYTHITRPRREYKRNVERLLNGKPYRPAKPTKFRRIHIALAEAVKSGKKIRLTIYENVPLGFLRDRERELIKQFGTLNG